MCPLGGVTSQRLVAGGRVTVAVAGTCQAAAGVLDSSGCVRQRQGRVRQQRVCVGQQPMCVRQQQKLSSARFHNEVLSPSGNIKSYQAMEVARVVAVRKRTCAWTPVQLLEAAPRRTSTCTLSLLCPKRCPSCCLRRRWCCWCWCEWIAWACPHSSRLCSAAALLVPGRPRLRPRGWGKSSGTDSL